MSSRGKLFILSAPAGTGKTTLISMLAKEFPRVCQSVSCTTRPKRRGEIDGVHYHFISQKAFEQKRAAGDFLEWAELFGNFYGTSRSFVEEELAEGRHLFLVIDVQGAAQIKEQMPCVSIFLSPPSMGELERRLRGRKTETPEKIAERLARAKIEMELSKNYDYHIINDDLDTAYAALRRIVLLEENKR
ncbi:MAG: guanylate kinase [Parachlamydiales bacterium]